MAQNFHLPIRDSLNEMTVVNINQVVMTLIFKSVHLKQPVTFSFNFTTCSQSKLTGEVILKKLCLSMAFTFSVVAPATLML